MTKASRWQMECSKPPVHVSYLRPVLTWLQLRKRSLSAPCPRKGKTTCAVQMPSPMWAKKIGPKMAEGKHGKNDVSSGSIYGIGFLAFYLTFFLAYLVILSIYSDILSDIFSDILSAIFSGIHSGPLYLTYIFTFSLTSLMAFSPAFFLTGVLTSFLACVRVRLCCRGACDRSQVCARRARHELLERSCSTWAGACWRSGSIGAEAGEGKRGEMTE